MATISHLKERLDRACREAVCGGNFHFQVSASEWALISVVCAEAIEKKDRVAELLDANSREVSRRRAAEAAVRSVRMAHQHMAQMGFALGTAAGLAIGSGAVALAGWLT